MLVEGTGQGLAWSPKVVLVARRRVDWGTDVMVPKTA